jgi:alpha-2-macroglobulin
MKNKKIAIVAIISLVIIALFYFLFLRETDKTSKKIDPGFTSYISGFTSGTISNQSSIRIILTDGIPEIENNSEVQKGLISFSPGIKGQTIWINNRTIEFRPESRLKSGERYSVTFKLGKLKVVPKKFEEFVFDFQVIKQSFSTSITGIKPYVKTDLERQKLTGVVYTADYADENEIKDLLEAKQNGNNLSVVWESATDGKTHSFQIDSIKRTKDQQLVNLKWNGNSIGVDSKSEDSYEIPSLDDFKIMNVSITQQPSQYITLSFSDPLDERQDLNGLIRLENNSFVRFIIVDNDIKVYPEVRQLSSTRIFVEPGVKNILGYKLKDSFSSSIRFQSIKPEVQFIGKGNILPSTNGLIFPFKAVNISAVNVKIVKIFQNNVLQFLQVNQFNGNDEMKRVGRIVFDKAVPLTADKAIDYGQWNTFSLDLSKLFKTEPGAIYRVIINFDKSQSLFPCEEQVKEGSGLDQMEEPIEKFDESDYDYWSWSGYDRSDYDYYDDYDWDEKDDPCKESYYARGNRTIARNIFASDLGIIAKGGNSKNMFFAVTDLKTTEPISGVTLEIYNFQQQLITTQTTDGNGIATIEVDKKPYVLIAKKGDQYGYLRLDDGSSLSLSMFNIGGNTTKKGIKGFIYGERGVWRPGDSLFISFILEDKIKSLPENHPIIFELIDPRGQIYARLVRSVSVDGLYDFRTKTSSEAPTGNWTAKVKVGGSVFEKTIKIETIKPNRLKIELDFGTEILSKESSNTGNLSVKWLHGAIAGNLKTDIEMRLAKTTTSFKNYPGFIFDNPSQEFYADESKIFEGTVDENGLATVKPNINVQKAAPGMLKASFKIRAFENSGDFSVRAFSLLYSPYSSYVGIKVPEGKGWNGALMSDKANTIPLVTVDEKGNPVSRSDLKVEIYKLYWRWWWERNEEDEIARYISNSGRQLEKTLIASTRNGEGSFELKLSKNYWGRLFVKVTDPVSGHSTGQIVFMDYSGWWEQRDNNAPGGATMLTFSLDKKNYNVGEEATITFPSSPNGRALISIESGTDVIFSDWVKTQEGSTSYKLKVTEKMAPNVYVYVALLQPHNQVLNDLPMRLYGIQPMMVEDPETHLKPVIAMPEVLAPNEKVTVQVSEENGKSMSYTIAVVDEGLLDLTNFVTPQPWDQFYSRDALGVKTWDMFDYVIGSFSGEFAGLLEIGGDEFADKKGSKQANRFKPVVIFLGPYKLKSGEKAKHNFEMPNYVGSVRTMVVAGYDGAYGCSEKTTPVKQPLMVVATMPRVVGPDEEVKLPVTVFTMDPSIKDVTVTVETNSLLIPTDVKSKKLRFEKEGDQMVTFDYKVASELGIGTVRVIAESGKEKAVFDIELNVRVANPKISEVISAVIEPGQTWSGKYEGIGMKGTNTGKLEVSRIMPINLENRLNFLIQYPHGCIEQTTSAVFPQLYLDSFIELSAEQKNEIQKNVRAGINKLRTFQQPDGGMSYWPGYYDESSEWGTNYAGHFMLEAKAKGYDLPIGWLDSWIKYQNKMARSWTAEEIGNNYQYRGRNDLIQAYRLYTLALAEKPALGVMNRMREMKTLSIQAKWRLAATYFLAGKPEVAEDLIKNLETTVKDYKEYSNTYGSSERDHAMIIETLTLMKDKQKAKPLIDELAKKLGSNSWYSTQTTAYGLMAISKFIGSEDGDKSLNFSYKINIESDKNAVTEMPITQFNLDMEKNPNGSVSISNKGKSVIFARIILTGIPAAGDQVSSENDLRMSIRYLDLEGKEIYVDRLPQGKDIVAEVTVQHPGIRSDYEEMALTQIFPSGWEIRNTRMETADNIVIQDKPEYEDIRDDRVYTYFDIKANQKKVFRIQLNATYLGKFYLPTIYCEAMYDNEVNAKKAGRWIEVVESGK